MSAHKHIDVLCLVAVLLSLALTALFMNGTALGLTVLTDGDGGDGQFTDNDLNSDWDASGATEIQLTGDGGSVTGNGAYFSDGSVHIVYAGKYVISGELDGGSVIVDADRDDKIWILLNGVSLRCEDGAALRVEQAGKVFLTLAEGTENRISSGADYDAALTAAGVDGAVYSRDDLTINGSGALAVTGEYRHGIVCNDDFVITGGTLSIDAAQDGIHAHDSARFANADVTINAGDDGVTVSNDEGTGYLYVASGRISIPSCYEGLEAISVTIDGGTIDITPTDDGINANGQGDNSVLTINGGEITIINPTGRDADGLDSNGSIYITGGRLFISVNGDGGSSAIDYGSENGGVCRISGGTVIACGGSAMAEGFDSSSPQAFLMHTASGQAGTAVSLEDGDGGVVLSETIPCAFSSVLLSAPELRLGESYTIAVGGSREQVVVDNSSATAAFGPAGMFGGMGGRGDRPGSQGDGMPSGGGMERPDAPQGMPSGQEPGGDGTDGPGEPPDGAGQGERPEDGEFPNAGGRPGGGEFPDNGEPPAQGDLPGGGDFRHGGGMPGQDGGMVPSINGTGGQDGTGVSPAALALVGVSVLCLLAGLVIALKVRH